MTEALTGEQSRTAAQQRSGALVGQLYASFIATQHSGYRQLFDQLTKPRLTLLKLRAERLAAAQGSFA